MADYDGVARRSSVLQRNHEYTHRFVTRANGIMCMLMEIIIFALIVVSSNSSRTVPPRMMIESPLKICRSRQSTFAFPQISKYTSSGIAFNMHRHTMYNTNNMAVGIEDISDGANRTTARHKTNRNEKLFQKRMAELEDFQFLHGHGSIPTPYPKNPSLGIWAANVRQQYSLWKRAEERGVPYIGYLTPSRRHALQLAGFDFTSLTERQFYTRLHELELFKHQYGHCMVPEKWAENTALGAWVSNLRTLYKKKRNIQQHREGAVQLRRDSEDVSMQNYEISQSSSIGNQKQRRNRRRLFQSSSRNLRMKRQRLPRFSHLDEERIQILEDIGFTWSSMDKKWLEMYEWTKAYGVINHAIKLYDAVQVEEREDIVVANNNNNFTVLTRTQIDNNCNFTHLLDNYYQFVQTIKNPSLLPSFHPQEHILEIFLGESFPQSSPPSRPTSSSSSSSSNTLNATLLSPFLDYRIRPNDIFHQPLRIWMINQRSNYNRRLLLSSDGSSHEEKQTAMTYPRQQALEAIYFPWSGRFRTSVEELKHKQETKKSLEQRRERKLRIERKEKEERERVEQLTSSIVAAVALGNSNMEIILERDVDIMTLWSEEEDDDDE